MKSGLGILESNRLIKIPKKYITQHEFCFFLHDSMLSMFCELAEEKYPAMKLNFENSEEALTFQSSDNPLGYLQDIGRRDIVKKLAVGRSMMAVWEDFFNFIYEGLVALEKRKFTVALALLRKPLKENLLLLTMMLVDEDKFFDGLEKSPAANLGHPGIQDVDRKQFFTRAKTLIPFGDFIDPLFLHDLIFDISFENGFAPIFDKATHLVTNRSQIRTEDLNLNLVFKNANENDIYEWIYESLSYVMLYAILLKIELFRKAGKEMEEIANWYSLICLGGYAGLFLKGHNPIISSLNKLLEPFLTCPHCDKPVKITKANSTVFFISHLLRCKHCKKEHDFPLFWLMSKTKWKIHSDGRTTETRANQEF